MGDVRGFLKYKRQTSVYRPVCERVKDFKDVVVLRPEEVSKTQASRCMDCGTPFCHSACPVSNLIPEWNDLVFHGQWQKAYDLLSKTNPLPEITGRLCPALCEYACVLGVNDDPVTIRENELAIIEKAFSMGWVKPQKPPKRTDKKVAIIGSGPAGLACAQKLNQFGHTVTVFEKDKKIGGYLRYGIPDFKLEKNILDRRLKIWQAEGVRFQTEAEADIKNFKQLEKKFDAICLTIGSRTPRDLNIPGRELEGIHFAMDYLAQQNRLICREIKKDRVKDRNEGINARDKRVVIIGGGDTGSDCVGTANRQGAKCVVQIELMPVPSQCRTEDMPWPNYPMLLKTSSSHEEGAERKWSILTKAFIGEQEIVKKILCKEVKFEKPAGSSCPIMQEIPGSEFEIEADLIILALGFLPQKINARKNIFVAGDARRGASLIVWAIAEGLQAAESINNSLF